VSDNTFEIDDSSSFEQNLEKFSNQLNAIDALLGPALHNELQSLSGPLEDREAILDRLLEVIIPPDSGEQ